MTDAFDPAFLVETPAVHGRPVLDWITASCEVPERFRAALERRVRELGITPVKSSRSGTDLYHDLISRHLGSGQRALRCYSRVALSAEGRWEDVSFDDLHARCGFRASWWAAHGVGPGTALCVILPFGVEFAVSLLAGLRLGAVVSWLEPRDAELVIRRLTALAPQHVATQRFIARSLGAFADLVLPPDGFAPQVPGSHTFGPGEPCLRLFSPLRASPAAVPVTAEASYTGALCDGLVGLALRPGDHIAAPGFHVRQHHPALLFAAWILRAAYIHVDEDDAVRDPDLLDAIPLRTIGLTPRVRDGYLAARRGRKPPWQHVVRNPEHPCDWEAWRDFVRDCELGEVAMSNLVMDAGAAGALLTSVRRPGKQYLSHLQDVVPAPGRPWQLIDFTRSGQPSAADAGVYARVAGEPGKPGKPIEPRYLVIARRGAEYLYGGTLEPRRDGRVFPVDDVVAIASRAAFLNAAAVVPVISGGAVSQARFVLVGFTGEPSDTFDAERAARCAELRRQLSAALGADGVPDRIELFPLYARKHDDAVDVAWCQAQYLGGLLFRKAGSPVFRRLTALRRALQMAAPSPLTPAQEARWP